MRVHSLSVTNFRGIKSATICLPAHAVLIGDNNTGKSSVLEAIDLVLGPDRLSRRPPVDEHDFFEGRYLAPATAVAEADHDGQPPVEAAGNPLADSVPPRIEIEVTITDLSEEQLARFGGRIEWLNTADGTLFVEANPAGIDAAAVVAALRVTFIGQYDPDDDDFTGATYFTRSLTEDDTPTPFRKTDKQHCGFLFLRSLRTGSRALSLDLDQLVHLICQYLRGRGGSDPGKGDLGDAVKLESALAKWNERIAGGQAPHANSVIHPIAAVLSATRQVVMVGDPDKDWIAIRATLADGACTRLRAIANDARNVRLLERGNLMRNTLEQNWRERGRYSDALDITRLAFVQDHFATAQRPETGVIVMNMHKAKGKQFDEVIVFEGWPLRVGKEIKANPDRIVRENKLEGDLSQARQNFRVSVTRAKSRTTVMTPKDDVCVLLKSD